MDDRGPDPADRATASPALRRSGVVALERCARRAMPATVERRWGGWWLRASPDLPFRRASSAMRCPDDPPADPEALADTLEAFAADAGVVARAQVGPLVAPRFDRALQDRGWVVEAAVTVLTAPLPPTADDRATVRRPPGVVPGVELADELDGGWAATFAESVASEPGAAERVLALTRLLPRVAAVVRVATVDDRRGPLAMGVGVVDGPWLGVLGMRTRPDRRRRGAARAVLAALVADGTGAGATRAWLQVEGDEGPAHVLYRRGGFRPAYAYHYRRAPGP